MNNEYGQNKYNDIKKCINEFNNSYEDKCKINKLMTNIIPIIKEIHKIKDDNNDPYIIGIKEAWVKNTNISTRTINKDKITSLLFDIDSYVNYYLSIY